MLQESVDLDVLHMRLETLQKQVEDQQEHIRVLRDTVSLKDRQADMLQSDVTVFVLLIYKSFLPTQLPCVDFLRKSWC